MDSSSEGSEEEGDDVLGNKGEKKAVVLDEYGIPIESSSGEDSDSEDGAGATAVAGTGTSEVEQGEGEGDEEGADSGLDQVVDSFGNMATPTS